MPKFHHAALVAALLAPLQAHAQPPDAARTFVKGLYDAYRHGEPAYLGAQAPTPFAPHLLALIRHDQATTPLGDSWRVADIHTKDVPSLVGFLDDGARGGVPLKGLYVRIVFICIRSLT